MSGRSGPKRPPRRRGYLPAWAGPGSSASPARRDLSSCQRSRVGRPCRCIRWAAGRREVDDRGELAQRGCAVLSDDVVALAESGVFRVLPALPYLCLWPDSATMVCGSEDSLPRFDPQLEKRCLALGTKDFKFERRSVPLRAIYLLRERAAVSATYIESTSAENALIALLANSYATRILNREMPARELDFLGRLISSVPIRSLHASHNADEFGELFRSIRQDTKGLEGLDIPQAGAAAFPCTADL